MDMRREEDEERLLWWDEASPRMLCLPPKDRRELMRDGDKREYPF